MGIQHSANRDALMYAAYPDNAFTRSSLDQDDVDAIKAKYTGNKHLIRLSHIDPAKQYTGNKYCRVPETLLKKHGRPATVLFVDTCWIG